MGASIVRKSKTAHETGGHRSRVFFIEYYCVLLFPLQKRQPEHREHFSLRKTKLIDNLGAQELQNSSQAKDPA